MFADLFLLIPFNLHDASKHHFASLKNDLMSSKQGGLERKFSWNSFSNKYIYFILPLSLKHQHNISYNPHLFVLFSSITKVGKYCFY